MNEVTNIIICQLNFNTEHEQSLTLINKMFLTFHDLRKICSSAYSLKVTKNYQIFFYL